MRALSERTDEIFERLSRIKESFDSTCKIAHRLLQHSHGRIDVYFFVYLSYNSSGGISLLIEKTPEV